MNGMVSLRLKVGLEGGRRNGNDDDMFHLCLIVGFDGLGFCGF